MFKQIKASEIPFPVFELKNKWMLITAEKDGKVNTMTASWGGFGIMWNKEVAFVVIRPQRYTKEFVDSADSFSLSFFGDEYKKQLSYLGSTSGRDENKIEKVGLTVVMDKGIPYFDEAETVVVAKKLFAQPITEDSFIDKKVIENWYSQKDFHVLYIAEIDKVLIKQ
ncbi:flavin reductase family protein [Paludibacter sp. 221]|uniref:flavin reductase n=1 Tax=Paludibacter sp. 221 TaxID=2302939 RepID=UPI0013D39E40|nr:flavin reductase [Paludibacter sp. 221]NDV47122.1 flavin reductase family protein [Paludibacter sp. 221]